MFPNVVLNKEVLAIFSIKIAPRDQVQVPFLRNVKASVENSSPALVEPTTEILPSAFLEDLFVNPMFNFNLGIAVPENDFFPVLGFQDFVHLYLSKTLSWTDIYSFLLQKYLSKSKAEKTPSRDTRFYQMLLKHQNGKGKNVLLFPGRWHGFSTFDAEFLRQAHPESLPENAAELNPQITGSTSGLTVETFHYLSGRPRGVGPKSCRRRFLLKTSGRP